jgi:formylglycine-generating enzyme required for sulfatase activity
MRQRSLAWVMLAALMLSGLTAWRVRAESARVAVLIVSRASDPTSEADAKKMIARLVELRAKAKLPKESLPILVYHMDKPQEADLCRHVLHISEDDVPFLGLVDVATDFVPYHVRARVNRSDSPERDAQGVFAEVRAMLKESTPYTGNARLPRTRTAKDGSLLVLVPAGNFTMGSTNAPDEAPPHTVSLAPFYIAKYDVTNAQYSKFVAATGYRSAGHWDQFAQKWGDKAPVVDVSWNDADAYCKWAGARLPTEAEWEKAARGTDGRAYPWGSRFEPTLCRSSVGHAADGPAAVGSYPKGASPYGVHDMAGNVWQWTASWYQAYTGNPNEDKREYGFTYHVLRGGSWSNKEPSSLTTMVRAWQPADGRDDYTGFRVAADP